MENIEASNPMLVTPIGLKINFKTIHDLSGQSAFEVIELIAAEMKTYHKGRYVIGHDTLYCDQPHFHIHMWSDKKVTMDALKQFKAKKLREKYNLTKSDKIYLGKDLPSADKLAWEGYACKEKMLIHHGYTEFEISEILRLAGTQLEIKRLRKIKSESLEHAQKEKQQFRDKMFNWIKDNYEDYVSKNRQQLSSHVDESSLEYGGRMPFVVKAMIVQFLINNEKFNSLSTGIVNKYYMQFQYKVEGKTSIDILLLMFQKS